MDSRRFSWLYIVIGLLAIASLAGAFVFLLGDSSNALEEAIERIDVPSRVLKAEPVIFIVEEGESAAEIGARLEEEGLIRSATLFRFLVAYYGVGTSLEAGEYELRADVTTTQIINRLHRGLVKTEIVTLPEGWRMEQMAEALERKGLFDKEDFLAICREGDFDYEFLSERSASATLEGYLFPDTYFLSPKIDAESFIRIMLQTFDSRFTDAMRQKAAARGMTVHEAITLASIVEREAVLPEERPLIAGVFLNRLELGMALDADPTVQYALANDPASVSVYGYWKEVSEDDLKVDSPYNTYLHAGLPPGPICSPGLASIEAVLDPEISDYLYFVAREDGSHAFSSTLEEHIENVRKYRS